MGLSQGRGIYYPIPAILKHSFIDMNIRSEYLKYASENRKDESSLNSNFTNLQENEEFLLCITTKGFGKRSSAYEYRISNRGGKGITGIQSTEKNGKVIDCFVVEENDQIILVSDKGQIIRINIKQVRIAGRSTQGVSIFKIPDTDKIVNVSRVKEIEDDK